MPTATIRVQPTEGDWVVRVDGAVIGESHRALELVEDHCAPVLYFPREDVAMAFLEQSETTVQSIRRGAASYFNIVTRSGVIPDAAWTIKTPTAEAAGIAGYLAFQPGLVTLEEL